MLLTDFRLPQEDGMKLIARAKSLPKPPICILMTAYGSEELAVEAMKHGADDYIAKGRLQIDELEMRIARALRQQNLEAENVALRQQLQSKFGLENIVGESPAMREVFDMVRQVAPTRGDGVAAGRKRHGQGTDRQGDPSTESARASGRWSRCIARRCRRRCWRANCSGTKKARSPARTKGGSGASSRRRAERCFWTKSGRLTPTVQVKLLRFLGERTFERVGSNKTLTADVRLIAATNKNLEEQVKAGKFREDLFFRLAVVEIMLPPLRERTGDIPLLAQEFSEGICPGEWAKM